MLDISQGRSTCARGATLLASGHEPERGALGAHLAVGEASRMLAQDGPGLGGMTGLEGGAGLAHERHLFGQVTARRGLCRPAARGGAWSMWGRGSVWRGSVWRGSVWRGSVGRGATRRWRSRGFGRWEHRGLDRLGGLVAYGSRRRGLRGRRGRLLWSPLTPWLGLGRSHRRHARARRGARVERLERGRPAT